MKSTIGVYKGITLLLLVFLLALAGVTLRFGPWMPSVFFGDDLSNLLAFKDGQFPAGIKEAICAAFAEKYRPVFVWAISALFGTFQEQITPYLAVNVVLHGLNATLVFAIAQRLGQGNKIVSLAVALAVATSRFALYQVTQVTGLLEGIALTLFLVMAYCMVRASDATKEIAWRWSWAALFAAFLAIHTHERYIVVTVWLGLAIMVLPNIRRLRRSQKLTLLGACVAMVLFNVLFKTTVLGMPFFVGTGGTRVDLNVLRILEHSGQALLSIFGFNEGPEYLVGARIKTLGAIWILAAAFALAWFAVVARGVRVVLAERIESPPSFLWLRFAWPLLLLALGALVLIPPVLTIRLEQRWLLEPFIVLLLLFAWAAGVLRDRGAVRVWILALAIGPGTVVADSFIASHFGQIFFVSSGQFALIAKRNLVDMDYRQAAPIALIASNDHCNWTLLNGEFFRLYGGVSRPLRCFGSVGEISSATLPAGTRIYRFEAKPLNLTDVTSELLAHADSRSLKVTDNFLESFSKGHINDSTKIETPSGKGAMIIPWDSLIGPRDTLTVVSGFSYRYDNVAIKRHTYLRFGITMVFPSRESARAVVLIKEEAAEPRVVYLQDLSPPRTSGKLKFEPISISLADFANKNVSITFITETLPGKDNSGHWVAFSEPRIVIDMAQ